jgi:hypothetical protein
MPAQIVPTGNLPPALPALPGGPRHDWSQLFATLQQAGPLTWCKILKDELPGKDDKAKRRALAGAIGTRKMGKVQTSVLGAHLYFRLIPYPETK